MGEVNGNPIYWQVVYQVGDIITVWMTDPYTAEYYNRSGGSINNSALLGYSTGQYSNYGNYSRSTLRDVTEAIYNEMITSFPVIANVVKTPSDANQTYQIGDSTYNKPTKYQFGSNYRLYYSHHNGLRDETSLDTAYYDYDWNTGDTPYTDEFWIPSWYEVFNYNNGGSSSNQWFDGGYWGLSLTDVGFSSSYTSTPLNGIGSVNSYCWLRSSYSCGNFYAMLVNSSGSAYDNGVDYCYGVRPAAHLSLSSLLERTKFKITTTVHNDTIGTTSGDGWFNKDGTESAIITATPNYGYVFNYWLEESTGNKIYNNPYTFTVTKPETYTAYFIDGYANVTTENNRAEILEEKILYDGIEQKISLSFTTSNYLTQIKFSGDSVPRSIKSVQTVYGDVANCTLATVGVNTDGSKAYISISAPTDSITITLYFTNTAQNYQATSGGGVETVAVQSTIGGSAELVGDDYINLTSGDTITVVARFKLNGYQFDGWYIDGELITTDMSARLTYDDIKGKVIVAQFSKTTNKTNTDTETEDNGGFV